METNANSKEEILRNAINTIAKELRTPLTNIIGMSDLLLESLTDPEQIKQVQTIMDSSDEISAVLKSVREIMAKDMKRTSIVLSSIERKDFIKQLEAAVIKNQYHNQLNLDVDVKIPFEFETDPEMLFQALLPLVKTTDQLGDGRITISLKKTQESQDWFYIKINIAKEKLNKFPRLEKTFLKKLEDKLEHLLVMDSLQAFSSKLHTLESDDSFNISFYVKFHYLKSEAANQQKSTLPDKFESDANVLIVEDNELNQLVTKLMVESFGCTVELAKNGKEALEKFNPDVHHCIFMDIDMPVMDGIEATKRLREKYGLNLPIIGLSADAMGGDMKKHQSFGFTDYLIKPVKKETLGQKIYFWVAKSKGIRS